MLHGKVNWQDFHCGVLERKHIMSAPIYYSISEKREEDSQILDCVASIARKTVHGDECYYHPVDRHIYLHVEPDQIQSAYYVGRINEKFKEVKEIKYLTIAVDKSPPPGMGWVHIIYRIRDVY